MRKLSIALVAALALPAAASAGGWATAGISPLPQGGAAGDEQTFTITVKRHGQTPEDGAQPAVVLTNPETGERRTFAAKPAGATGVYRVTVTWPEEGTWRFAVDDGLEATGYGISQTHTFGAVAVAGASAGAAGSGGVGWTVGGSVVLAIALTVLLVAGLRRRPTAPSPVLD